LPWARASAELVGSQTRSAVGEGAGGWLFVAGGVLIAGLAARTLTRGFRRDAQVVLVLLAVAVLGAGSWVYSDISHQFSDLRESIDSELADVGADEVGISSTDVVDLDHGVGLYVTLAGGALALAGVPRRYGRQGAGRSPGSGP
jgi:hypothetical protein